MILDGPTIERTTSLYLLHAQEKTTTALFKALQVCLVVVDVFRFFSALQPIEAVVS